MDPTAVMGKRIGAYIIDAILGSIISIATFWAVKDSVETGRDLCDVPGSPTLCVYVDGTTYFADESNASTVFIAALGAWLFFGWILLGLTGGTPGKLLVGLRVVDQNTGQLAGLGKCLGRTLMWIVDGQLFGLPLVALITGSASKGHRRVGDMVAKTFVVNKDQVGKVPHVPGLTAPAGGVPGGYSPPPPGDWAPPATPVVPAPAAPVAETAGTSTDGINAPKWDAERGAYIQWDKDNQLWMIYDDTSSQWKPLT